MRRLTGRTALVTGRGRDVALGLAAEGALVAVHGPDAEAVVTKIRDAGGRAFSVPTDDPVGGLLAGLGHERLDLLVLAGSGHEIVASVTESLDVGRIVDMGRVVDMGGVVDMGRKSILDDGSGTWLVSAISGPTSETGRVVEPTDGPLWTAVPARGSSPR